MALKGINPIEQHVEKGVAALFGLALLGVLAWQFLGGQSMVKIGTTEVPIADAYPKLAESARQLDRSIQATPVPPTPEDVNKVTHRYENFEAALKAPVAPHEQLAGPLDKPGTILPGGKDLRGGQDTAIVEVTIPAPEHPVAGTYLATVATSEAQSPEVAKILPSAAPFDKAAVTVEAVVDGTAIRKAFEETPTGDKAPRPVPKNWWENGVQILAVELHRQTLKPDGSWSDPEKVKGMPGRPLLVDQADSLNDAESLRNALKIASDTDMVRRTPYYLVSMGEAWAAPTERDAIADAGQDKAGQVKKLRGELTAKDRFIKSAEDDITKAGQPVAPTSGGGGGGGGRGHGGGGGGAAPSPAAPPTGNSGEDQRLKGLRARLAKLKGERQVIVDKLKALGETVEGAGNDQQTPIPDQKQTAKTETPVLDNANIRIWAHDVTVERGKTYRYQIGIVLTNPYFGHSAAMVPAQADKLAKSGVMHSAGSEWTEPVTVDREAYTFFTSAVEDDSAAGQNAYTKAEMFVFKWGFWRRGRADFEPGDRLMASISVPDFTKFLAAPPAADPNNPNPAPAPSQGRPGGRNGGGAMAPSSPSPAPGQGGDAPAIPAGAQIPMMSVPVPSSDMILGVGHGPSRGSSGKSSEVFVREGDGSVRVVQPDVDRADPVFVRITKSAEMGLKDHSPPSEKAKPGQQQTPGTPDMRDNRPPAAGG